MKNFKDIYEKKVDIFQRKKMARRMAKMARSAAFQMKKAKSLLKMRSPAKIAIAARKKVIQMFRDKMYPGYANMALPQKVKADQLVMQRFGKKIDKISKKMAGKLQRLEVDRVKKAREKAKEK